MNSLFAKSDLTKIGKILGIQPKPKGNNFRFEFQAADSRRLALEIYPDISIGRKKGNLISAYTQNTHFQLHFCNAYVVSKDIGEVTFVSETKDKVSAIVIEKEGGCTFYSNVDKSILSGDYRMLAVDVMLAGIALSLTHESVKEKKKK